MATSSSLTATQKLKELVECGICANVKDLHVFKCQHRVCKDCIIKLRKDTVRMGHGHTLRTAERILCPFCRQSTIVAKLSETLPRCRLSAEITDILKQIESGHFGCSISTQTNGFALTFSRQTQTTLQDVGVQDMMHQFQHASGDSSRPTDNKKLGIELFTPTFLQKEIRRLHEHCSFVNVKKYVEAMRFYSSVKSYNPVALHSAAGSKQSTMKLKADFDKCALSNEMVIADVYKEEFEGNVSVSFEMERWSDKLIEQRSKLNLELLKVKPCNYNLENLQPDGVQWFRKPGFSFIDDPNDKTAIQSLRAKRIRRVIPKNLYKSRLVWRSFRADADLYVWEPPLVCVGDAT